MEAFQVPSGPRFFPLPLNGGEKGRDGNSLELKVFLEINI
jgi:hypothetical protein